MSTVIKIENLSKKYVIGHQKREQYTALRDVTAHKKRTIGQRLRHPLSPNKEESNIKEFWALKDINLEESVVCPPFLPFSCNRLRNEQ